MPCPSCGVVDPWSTHHHCRDPFHQVASSGALTTRGAEAMREHGQRYLKPRERRWRLDGVGLLFGGVTAEIIVWVSSLAPWWTLPGAAVALVGGVISWRQT